MAVVRKSSPTVAEVFTTLFDDNDDFVRKAKYCLRAILDGTFHSSCVRLVGDETSGLDVFRKLLEIADPLWHSVDDGMVSGPFKKIFYQACKGIRKEARFAFYESEKKDSVGRAVDINLAKTNYLAVRKLVTFFVKDDGPCDDILFELIFPCTFVDKVKKEGETLKITSDLKHISKKDIMAFLVTPDPESDSEGEEA